MATLREIQLALQQKIEELREKDEQIDELEEEMVKKEQIIRDLKEQVIRYKSMVKRLTYFEAGRPPGQPISKLASSSHHQLFPPNSPTLPTEIECELLKRLSADGEHKEQQQAKELRENIDKTDKEVPKLNVEPTCKTSEQTPPQVSHRPNAFQQAASLLITTDKMKGGSCKIPFSAKEANNNSHGCTVASVAKKRLLFSSERAKSESPLFVRFRHL